TTKTISSVSTRMKIAAVKPRIRKYASWMCVAFGDAGATGAKPPFPAAATPAAASASSTARTKDVSLRRTRRAFYEGVPALADRTAGPCAARLRRLRGRRPPGARTGLRGRGKIPRLPASDRPGGQPRLLALGFDVARDRGHVPQARDGRRRLRGRRVPRGRDRPATAAVRLRLRPRQARPAPRRPRAAPPRRHRTRRGVARTGGESRRRR